MKKHTVTAVAIVLAMVMILVLPLASFAEKDASAGNKKTFVPWDSPTDDYVPVCTGNQYTLSVRAQDQMFVITDTAGTPIWYSAMTPDTYSELEDNSDEWLNYMTSLLSVNYTTKRDTRGNFNSAYSAAADTITTVLRGEDGVRFEFEFTEFAFSLAMEISLQEDRLVVDIPAEDIREDGDCVIYSVEVLPFFAASAKEKNADGYLVYPDGSGAISYFDRVDDKSAFAQPITLDVYDTLNLEDTLNEQKAATASLPIYGVKINDTAVLAAVTQGSENARINVNSAVSNATVPIHRNTFELFYRNDYRIYLSNIKGLTADTVSKTYGTKLDTDLQRIDRQICYFLLRGDDADYSGMAVAYRDYLLREGILSEQKALKDMSLFLTLFMGIKKEGALINSDVTVTSYDDTREICGTLAEQGVSSLNVTLRGWSGGGYGAYPQSGDANSALGGKSGLAALNDFVGKQTGLTIQLETELLLTDKNRHIAVKGTSLPITDVTEKLFLLSPARVKQRLDTILKKTGKYDNLSLALSTIGTSVYPDYNKTRYGTRGETVKAWETVLADPQVTGVRGGNLYALSSASYLYDLPDTCSYQQLTDQSIPWYFMIMSGSLPYTTTAGNRTGDLIRMKLRWAECGAMPYFELTKSSVKDLRDTAYNSLFTSTFANWDEKVVNVYTEMKEKMAPVVSQKMKKHTMLGDQQVLVTYENDYAVLINYADEPFTYDGQTVAAQDYTVYRLS